MDPGDIIGADAARTKLEFDKVLQRILRFASSDPGRRLLTDVRIQSSVSDIRYQQSLVTESKRLLEEEDAIPLEGLFEIRESLAKASLEGSVLLPEELRKIGSSAGAARQVRAFLAKRKDPFPLLWDCADPLHTDKVLEFNIDQAIDENGSVRDRASKELQTIRRSIAEQYASLRRKLESILRHATAEGFTQDEIITTREGRMVIPVKTEHKHRVPGFVHSASASGATVFVEPAETLELNNAIRSLHFQEQREIERILRSLTQQVRETADHLLQNQSILATLDALQAKGRYSIEILGVEPRISAAGPVKIRAARHPILLMHHGRQGTVPLDLTLGDAFRTLVISGPNAGGKSVAMKCVGLIVLMAQAGLHVPATEETELRPFQKFFVTIGDDQSIESDLSTFSSHLKALREIAEQADDASLVLIDEIGAGTDPAEGSAIAASLLGALTERGAFTIATTHQGFLKVFAHDTEGVENGAMEFDITTLTPTYRYREGVPGSSYALEMAERIGLDERLMARARSLMGGSQTRMESLLTELEASAQEQRRRTAEMAAQQASQEALLAEYQERMQTLNKEIRARRQAALAEAKAIIENSNALIERLVKDIKESGAQKEVVGSLRRETETLRKAIEAAQAESDTRENGLEGSPGLAVGSMVRIAGSADIGEVVGIAEGGESATVVFGSIKIKVPLAQLAPAKGGQPRRASTPAAPSLDRAEMPARELDLRGMTGDEALPLIDKFLDDAFLAGLRRIDIIHGKGTGALRKRVTEFLSEHQRVSSFRPGEWNEGGLGVTVVEVRES